MRDSRLPRGTWTAPGMWPSSHSFRSRTSTKTGASGLAKLRGRRRVDLVDLALDLLEELAVARHCFRKYSYLPAASRKGRKLRSAACPSAAPASWSASPRPLRRRSSSASPCSRAGTRRLPRRRRSAAPAGAAARAGAARARSDAGGRRPARGRAARRRGRPRRRPRPLRGDPRREPRVRGGRGRRRDRLLARGDGGAARGARRRAIRRAPSPGSTSAWRSWRAATRRARVQTGARRSGSSPTRRRRCAPRISSTRSSRPAARPSSRRSRPRPSSRASRRRSSSPSSSGRPRPAASTSASSTASPCSVSAGRSRRGAAFASALEADPDSLAGQGGRRDRALRQGRPVAGVLPTRAARGRRRERRRPLPPRPRALVDRAGRGGDPPARAGPRSRPRTASTDGKQSACSTVSRTSASRVPQKGHAGRPTAVQESRRSCRKVAAKRPLTSRQSRLR